MSVEHAFYGKIQGGGSAGQSSEIRGREILGDGIEELDGEGAKRHGWVAGLGMSGGRIYM